MTQPQDPMPPLWLSALRILWRIAIVVGLALLIAELSGWLMTQSESGRDVITPLLLLAILLAYAALIAIPFVPGIEIGVALLMLQGATMAPFVYAATALGLFTAFSIGRLIPEKSLARSFADLRLKRAAQLVNRLAPISPAQRLTMLANRLPKWAAPLATRYRYLTLALLLNIPGNAIIGGGGGISLLAGLSRLYGWRGTTATLLAAIAPVPLLVWAFGQP